MLLFSCTEKVLLDFLIKSWGDSNEEIFIYINKYHHDIDYLPSGSPFLGCH